MITPEPPAGSEHYREGWRHGYEQAAIDRERSADAVTAEARVLVARCDNYREDVDAPCTGEIRFRWGMSQSDPCDVCGSRCGIAVAAWERVELPTPAHPANCQSCSGLLTDHDCDDRRWSLVAFERCFAAGPAAASPPGDTEKAHEVAEAMLGRLADKLTSLRRRLATAMGHDEVPDDDGLVKDVAWYVQMLRARDDTVPAGSVECDQCGGSGVTGPSGDTVQAPDVAGPLVAVRVGSPGSGYLVGPFTPAEAVAWRKANVTVPGMQWAIVPLLPDAARPTAEAVLGTDTPEADRG